MTPQAAQIRLEGGKAKGVGPQFEHDPSGVHSLHHKHPLTVDNRHSYGGTRCLPPPSEVLSQSMIEVEGTGSACVLAQTYIFSTIQDKKLSTGCFR
jgi:hypothetical protein